MAAWNPRANEIFVNALEKPDAEFRTAYLDEACDNDDVLRQQVEALLAAHLQAGSFFDKPPMKPTLSHEPIAERVGTTIGPYKLLQQIGEGGMGVVYMAEQQEPVRRMVALKIIKPGMDTRQVIARFESERQALALMDHPNIARVLDAGATESGLPYFVMELVKGIPINKFCDENQIPPRQRLELFVSVCQAVQHAHQKGIIHRDLKPSNVLIAMYDDRPVPKIIDFGVAKATSQKLTERTLFTEFGSIVGTLEYMSPEQAKLNALDIDTRSDVYALGVLLYELLTGTTPLERSRLRELGYEEMLRLIREEEAPRPSTRLSSTMQAGPALSPQRRTAAEQLTKLLRGELDWIVLKALEKDRTRRYDTASAFARDIERYLKDEPVEACSPSLGYRMRKLVKRNRGPVTIAAIVALTLLAGIVGTSWGWVEALWQRDDAVQARKDEANQRRAAFAAVSEQAKAEETARIAAQNEARALVQAGKAETARADEARRKVRLVEAHLALERGMNACERDQVQEGLLWLARGLEAAPDDEVELRLSLRRLLAAWSREVCTLKQVTPFSSAPWAISPNRKLLAESFTDRSGDSILYLRDVDTGKFVQGPMKSPWAVHQVVFSPDGSIMASSGHERELRNGQPGKSRVQIFAVATGKPVGKPIEFDAYDNHLGLNRVKHMAFSADCTRLLTLAGEKARLWEVDTGKLIGEPWSTRHAMFSPDGKLVAMAGLSGVDLFDARTGNRAAVTFKHGFGVSVQAFSLDSKCVVSGGNDAGGDGFMQVDAATGKPLTHEQRVASRLVRQIAFAPTGKLLAVQSEKGIELFSWPERITTPINLPKIGSLIPDFGSMHHPDKFAFSPDGQRLVTISTAGQLRIYDTNTATLIGAPIKHDPHSSREFNSAFDEMGKTVVTTDSHQRILRWQLPQPPSDHQHHLPDTSHLTTMAVSPDGKTIGSSVLRCKSVVSGAFS